MMSIDPHAYNDYEKFNFSHASKPYLEFPVESSGEYEGGSPGADRIVIGSIAEDYSGLYSCLRHFGVVADIGLSSQARLSTAQSLPTMAAPRTASLNVRMTA